MVYLDNNATTPLHPEVLEVMLPYLRDAYGNPSAGYRLGRQARKAIDTAREQVAGLIGAAPEEIVFTSGGTEAINTALLSAVSCYPDRRSIITSTVEHSATEKTCLELERRGLEIQRVGVDGGGLLKLEDLDLQVPPAVVSLIWANNETGVISPIAEAAELANQAGCLFHTDAVQAVGKIPMDVRNIHLLSLSGHKLHGPKGIGALYVSRKVRFHPFIFGGGQENGRRSGTENVAGIVGLGKAAELMRLGLAGDRSERLRRLRDEFELAAMSRIEGIEINGDPKLRLPNTANLYFRGVDAEALLVLLDEQSICCSPGSACSTGGAHPSAVLTAMGFSSERAKSSVRFSFSEMNTAEEVEIAVSALQRSVEKFRSLRTGSVVRRS